jgi:catechol 2,3-dioxygenase-like lactoylglutathione lyase family enzyme
MIRVVSFDHLVLNVADIERSMRWYMGMLGLQPVRLEEWRRGECAFPSVRVSEHTMIDICLFDRGGENCDHFCLVVDPVDFEEVKRSGRFDVVTGPVSRFGSSGWGHSLYVRDPDGNMVELRCEAPLEEAL